MTTPFAKPIVYCISEGLADDSNFLQSKRQIIERVRNASRCGVTHFQVREKKLSADMLFDLTAAAAAAAREAAVRLLVNGRADIALAADADGVHLPSDGLPARELRRTVPENFLIGASTHSIDEAETAREAGADFITFGPVFQSPGKGEGVGVSELAIVCRHLGRFPVVALGGIGESRVGEVLEHGAAGFAAIRYLNDCLSAGRGVSV